MGILLFEMVVDCLEKFPVVSLLHIFGHCYDPTADHPQILTVIDGQRITIGQCVPSHDSLILPLLICRNSIFIQAKIVIQMGSGRINLLITEIYISFAPILIERICSANMSKDMPQTLFAKFLIMCQCDNLLSKLATL